MSKVWLVTGSAAPGDVADEDAANAAVQPALDACGRLDANAPGQCLLCNSERIFNDRPSSKTRRNLWRHMNSRRILTSLTASALS
jgi:hypothetical protein